MERASKFFPLAQKTSHLASTSLAAKMSQVYRAERRILRRMETTQIAVWSLCSSGGCEIHTRAKGSLVRLEVGCCHLSLACSRTEAMSFHSSRSRINKQDKQYNSSPLIYRSMHRKYTSQARNLRNSYLVLYTFFSNISQFKLNPSFSSRSPCSRKIRAIP